MAEAYATLLNVMQIIAEIQQHPRPPISLDERQAESLIENLTFLQEYLEGYNKHVGYSKEADPLEMQIADAAHAAEDVIESHIVDQILADGGETSSIDFCYAMQKVIDDMEFVKKVINSMDVKEKMRDSQCHFSTSAASSSSASPGQKITMVGFDDLLFKVLDKLTCQESSLQIISITGMGGIGKTTLARNVYEHQLVEEYFDFRAMVTVSQEYDITNILLEVLEWEGENLIQVDENELGCKLHKKLLGRRYLVIIDDIWNVEVWDQLRLFLPDYKNGSRIMITTRISNLACETDYSHHNIKIDFLDVDESWELFCKHVFGKEDCTY